VFIARSTAARCKPKASGHWPQCKELGSNFAVIEAVIEAGATTVNIPDTVGYTTPREFARVIRTLREQVRGIQRATISVHCHNDLGMAVANSVSGALGDLDAGQDAWINTCVNGIGERGGNADLVFKLVQLCASATGKPLTDDELRLIAAYPHQLALLYPGFLS